MDVATLGGLLYSLSTKDQIQALDAILKKPDLNSLENIMATMKQKDYSEVEVTNALDELCALDILFRVDEDKYEFTIPIFRDWLTQNPTRLNSRFMDL